MFVFLSVFLTHFNRKSKKMAVELNNILMHDVVNNEFKLDELQTQLGHAKQLTANLEHRLEMQRESHAQLVDALKENSDRLVQEKENIIQLYKRILDNNLIK